MTRLLEERIEALEAEVFGTNADADDAPEVSTDLTRPELDDIAADAIEGYDPKDYKTKADVVAAINAAADE